VSKIAGFPLPGSGALPWQGREDAKTEKALVQPFGIEPILMSMAAR
jgi:hypothetical protein